MSPVRNRVPGNRGAVPLHVPADLEEALAQSPAARARFDRLPPEGKDAWIAWVGRARLRSARRRRIAETVRRLGVGPAAAATTEERVERPAPLPPGTPWEWWLLALLLLLVIAGLLIWLLAFRDHGHKRGAVVVRKGTVPNFVGQPLPQAKRLAAEAGVTPVVTRRASDRPKGIVVDQRPAPGKVVPSGSVVTLVVSRGPPKVSVPDVTGLAAADASKRLGAVGLVPKLAPTPSAKPPGTVIAQTPRAGAKAARGSKVTLQVAKAQTTTAATTTAPTTTTKPATTHAASTAGTTTVAAPTTTRARPAGVLVPSLAGKSLQSALPALEQAGLLATVKYVSAPGPLGQVNGQNPAAGTRVPRGTRVQVNVTEGSNPGNPTQVPDVTGEDEATARSDLESAGFKVIVVRTRRSGTAGSVLEQQPAAGTTISSGDFVAIYVP
jgi:eukaryotic-like serine/threonine-protein kinase